MTHEIELRRDFEDAEHWSDLAKKMYVRLPIWKTPCTETSIRKWLRRFRVDVKTYLDATGYKKITDFMEYNPDWPLRAFVGLLLEYVNERDEAKGVLRAYDR